MNAAPAPLAEAPVCPCSGPGGSDAALWLMLAAIVALWWLFRVGFKRQGGFRMNRTGKIVVVAALAAVVGVVVATKSRKSVTAGRPAGSIPPQSALPRLLDLGSKSCIPCKMMAPILEELKTENAGRLRVDFIDVNEDRQAAVQYRIKLIPTQIFFDAAGKELFRHEGFYPKEEILAKWKALGVSLNTPAPAK